MCATYPSRALMRALLSISSKKHTHIYTYAPIPVAPWCVLDRESNHSRRRGPRPVCTTPEEKDEEEAREEEEGGERREEQDEEVEEEEEREEEEAREEEEERAEEEWRDEARRRVSSSRRFNFSSFTSYAHIGHSV